MMRKPLILFLIMICVFLSCSEKKPEDIVGKTAAAYYQDLITGKYDDYVAGMDRTERVPEAYRQQLITMTKQFVVQQKEERGGMTSVKVVTTVLDRTKTVGDVYLEVSYGDSANEEVVIPMVLRNGKWKMK